MIMKTHKRKLQPEAPEEVSDRSSLAWERQRQFVFSVSMHKYQQDQETPEPSLRRSVLITNTLRQMEACQASSVGLQVPLLSDVHEPKEQLGVAAQNDLPSPPKCQRVVPNGGKSVSCAASLPLSADDEDWSLLAVDPDFSISPAISTILTGLDSTIDVSTQVCPRTALRSLENLPASPDAGVFWLKQVRGHGRCWEQQQEFMEWEASMEVSSASYLKDVMVEDMFQDIDTSQLERDMGILGLRASGAAYPTAEDLQCLTPLTPSTHSQPLPLNHHMKGLPSFSSFSAHMREGLELENLMTTLVES
ncbi:SERTA domain-containing protein 3 [Dunckerocampus dactyliophorus]|uniref:SERTA domain-containing protein 3 n=1 Tax=Dunckerocampus dactyliophorus TaxID=161453 RepID=UPI002404E748|nr:SERTA domain-containing protein 3 [Dunckerocampus dactyliophorus]XP_054651095.1 SERTA domain-containing protein 3 [Dunckerocampus dactyliophorus]XP_054651096.1 SERTA domain-containing protein 3 [Dunckerocampus dactyliophorus]